LRKFQSLIQDFLAMVLFSKRHIFSRDSLIAFDSYCIVLSNVVTPTSKALEFKHASQ